MDKRTRAGKIAAVGVEAYPDDNNNNNGIDIHSLISSIAAMIDYATKKPVKKPKAPLLYTERDVVEATGLTLTATRYGGLNAQLSRMSLLPDDLELFTVWFRDDMYPWMVSNAVIPTFSMLTRKYPEWLEKARLYEGTPDTTKENWR